MAAYHTTFCALVGLVFLWWIQSIVSGVVSLPAKHVPGMPVTSGHDDGFFRVFRAFANTNENLTAFALAALLAVALGAGATWVNRMAVTFVVARVVHAIAYYADVRLLRSTAYVVGMVATLVLAILAAQRL